LQAPGNLQRELLEQTVAQGAQSRLTQWSILARNPNGKDAEKQVSHAAHWCCRCWAGICYAVKDNMLIFSNSDELLKAVLDSHETDQQSSVFATAELDELTILRSIDARSRSMTSSTYWTTRLSSSNKTTRTKA